MVKNDELVIIGGIILVGGALLFWKDIAKALNFKFMDGGSMEMEIPEEEVEYEEEEEGLPYDRFDKYEALSEEDYGEDENCKIPFAQYCDYYAIRVGEELDKYSDKVSGNTKMEVKGRVLLSYKDDLKKMFKMNKKCVRPLTGEARAIFIDIILRVAERADIEIPSSKKKDWKRLVNEELNKREPQSVFSVTKISVM